MNARTRAIPAIAAACILLSFPAPARADDEAINDPAGLNPASFEFAQEIETTGQDAEYFRFPLDATHYRACRDDLGDIRIFDMLGAQCPYAVDSREIVVGRETKRIAAVETGRGTTGEGDAAVSWREYQIVDFESPLEINGLSLEVATGDFSARLEAYGRDAKSDWSRVGADTVYRISGVEKNAIEFDSILSYQFWRVEYRGAAQPFGDAVTSVVLDRERTESKEFRKETELSFSVTSKDGHTVIKVENPDRLALTAISIEAPLPFRRSVTVVIDDGTVAKDEIYRIRKGADEARHTAIALDWPVRSKTIELGVKDGDDSPLAVSRITAEYAIDKILFRPTGKGPYRLAFGNAAVTQPAYDIARYREDIDPSLIREVTLLAPAETPGFRVEAADGDVGKKVFSAIVVLTAIALSAFVVAMLFRQRGSSSR